jgi:Tol biopolymer transport system component
MFAWLDRAGQELKQVGPSDVSVRHARASPGGRRVAVAIHNPQKGAAEIWVFDKESHVNRVVVPGPGNPVWSSDGKRLLYSRALGRGPKLYMKGLAEEDPEQDLPSTDFQLATEWSQHSRFTVFNSETVIDGDGGMVDASVIRLS